MGLGIDQRNVQVGTFSVQSNANSAAEKIRREMLRGGGDAVDKAMGIDRSPTKKKGGATMKITPPPGAEGAKPKDDVVPGAAPAAAPEKK